MNLRVEQAMRDPAIRRIAQALARLRLAMPVSLVLLAAACTGPTGGPHVRTGAAAYAAIPASTANTPVGEARIGPADVVDITIFDEPDISPKGLVVDAAGNIAMPLIGRVHAAGLTATELADTLQTALGANLYQHPQATVTISSSVAQQVTVEGEVTVPGIFALHGPATLLDTLALAHGETENAAIHEVVVIRTAGGTRRLALFDVARIRRGDDEDPAILGRDVVVVGHSNTRQIYHDLLKAAPLLNVFTQF